MPFLPGFYRSRLMNEHSSTSSEPRKKGRATVLDELIGEQLLKARIRQSWSQDRLARAVGVTFQQIQKYENGVNRISASRLYMLAKTLGYPIGFFYETAALSFNDNTAILQQAKREADREIYKAGQAICAISNKRMRNELLDMAKTLARQCCQNNNRDTEKSVCVNSRNKL